MVRINMSAQYGIGCGCWTVTASLPGVPSRTLRANLKKKRAEGFVEFVNHILQVQESNRIPNGQHVIISRRKKSGYGRCSVRWEGVGGLGDGTFEKDLSRQKARPIERDVNDVVDQLAELKSSAMTVERLEKQIEANAFLASQGAGPAVRVLLEINEAIKAGLRTLRSGQESKNGRAA